MVSRLRLKMFSQHFSSAYGLSAARIQVLKRKLNFSSPTTRTRVLQQANTDDPMRTPTRLLIGTQRTPTSTIAKCLTMPHFKPMKTESESGAAAAFSLYGRHEIEIPYPGRGPPSQKSAVAAPVATNIVVITEVAAITRCHRCAQSEPSIPSQLTGLRSNLTRARL